MLQKFKLQTSFVLMFSLVIFLLLSLLYTFMNFYVFKEYKQSMVANALQLNNKLTQQIDFYFDDLIQLSKTSVTNQNLVNDIKALDSLPNLTLYDHLNFDRSFESHSSYLVNYSSLYTSNVYIFGRQNQFKFTYGFLPLKSNFETIMSQPTALEDRLSDNNVLVHFANENTGHSDADPPSISIIRAFSDLSGSVLGYIEFQQDYKKLTEISYLESNSEVYIRNKQGKVVFPTDKLDAQTNHSVEQAAQFADTGWHHGDDFYTAVTSPGSEFTTIIRHSNEMLFKPLYTLQRTTLVTILSIAGLAVVIVYLVTFSMTTPIRKLRSTVLKLDLDNVKLFSNFRSPSNEVNLLNDAFHAMIGRLQLSMDREIRYKEQEMKARFSALQSQISPHFIHNVLYLISISAQEDKKQQVVDLTKQLSDMLRYTADSHYQRVSLEAEMNHTRNYLLLMQSKYEDFITFDITYSEEAKSIMLPRMTIQPFVENAIQHAFSQSLPPWQVTLSCQVSDGMWELNIIDNGAGMDEETLQPLREEISGILEDPADAEQVGFGGMGIVNTVTRLKLTFPDSLNVRIDNLPEGGVRLCIRGSILREERWGE